MALDLGELVARLRIDDSHYRRGLQEAPKAADQAGTKIGEGVSQAAAPGVSKLGRLLGSLPAGLTAKMKTAQADIRKDFAKLEESLAKVGAKAKEKLNSVAGVVGVGLGTAAVVGFVKESVSAFAEYEDAAAAAGVVFGSAMSRIQRQADTASSSLLMSKTDVINAAMAFGTFGKGAGLAGDKLASFSTSLVARAGDLASFRGGLPTDAVDAFTSALAGETEPLRRYGVVINEATLQQRALSMGLITSTKEALNPHARALAVQAEIMEQTKDAAGDVGRTYESTANTAKRLQAESANLSIEIGQKLAPAMVEAQRAGIGIITWATRNQEALVPLIGTMGVLVGAFGAVVGATKAFQALKQARDMVNALKTSFMGLSAASRTAILAAGGIGLALTAAAAIYGVFAQSQADAKQGADDFAEALKQDNAALGENVRLTALKKLEDAGIADRVQQLGGNMNMLVDAVLGNTAAWDQFVRTHDTAWGDELKVKELNGQLVAGQAAMGRYQTVANTAADATGNFTTQTQNSSTQNKTQKKTLDDVTAALWRQQTAMLAMSGSKIGWERTIDDVAAAVKKLGKVSKDHKSFDLGAEKGRQAQEQLDNLFTSYQSLTGQMIKNHKSAKEVAEVTKRTREEFIRNAEKLGLNSTAAKDLADKYGLIPGKVTTTIKSELNKDGINAWGDWKPEDKPANVVTQVQNKNAWDKWNPPDKTAHVHIQYKLPKGWKQNKDGSVTTPGGSRLNVATGGAIRGPGSGTSDSIPAMLSNGEHVFPAAEVQQAGGQDAIYRMRALIRSGMMRFANGGAVDPVRRMATGGSVSPLASLQTVPAASPISPLDLESAMRAALNGARIELGSMGVLADVVAGRIVLGVEGHAA